MTAAAVAVQSDGKIVVAGDVTASELGVARYNTDGSLDNSFGTGGLALMAVPSGDGQLANRITLQPDGKILVVGNSDLARFISTGTPDSSFGTVGLVTLTPDGSDLALQPDGKILVLVGIATQSLERFNPDGSLDASFGSGGHANLNPASAGEYAFVLQPDGRIIVAGSLLERYNPDGTIDSSFGTGGQVTLNFSGAAADVALQPNGRIVVAGQEVSSLALERFDTNGSVDTTFGSDGLATFQTGVRPEASRVLIQGDGKILVDGNFVYTGFTQSFHVFLLARCNPNGTLDPTFGNSGPGVTTSESDQGGDIALQSDGKIVSVDVLTYVGSQPMPSVDRLTADPPISDPNQRFLAQVYLDLLQRPIDPSGLAGWSSALTSGATPAQVVAAIESSPEYHTLEVAYLYGFLLNRQVDPLGNSSWVNYLNQGGTYQQLQAMLLGSAEYYNTRGGETNTGYLQALYTNLLQRQIDPVGTEVWGQALASGTSRSTVAADILGSIEADTDAVEALYYGLLRRAADPSGLNAYVTALQAGVTNEAIVALIAGSNEYFNLF